MSLRIIVKTDQIKRWIGERNGQAALRTGTDDDLAVFFDGQKSGYEPVSVDEFVETMKANHLVLMVDQEPGKTFHKFVRHG